MICNLGGGTFILMVEMEGIEGEHHDVINHENLFGRCFRLCPGLFDDSIDRIAEEVFLILDGGTF